MSLLLIRNDNSVVDFMTGYRLKDAQTRREGVSAVHDLLASSALSRPNDNANVGSEGSPEGPP